MLVKDPDLADWRRFWSETEAALLNGITQTKRLGPEPVGLFAQLARDRFGDESSPFLRLASALPKSSFSGPGLAPACTFRHPSLLRSLDDAHTRGVSGVLALDDRLVSWGEDGAIRFWDQDGNRLPSGDASAHAHSGGLWDSGVLGVLALGERLVSWGGDGAIRFWDRDGQTLLPPWLPPAPLEMVTVVEAELWIGLLGRPFRLVPGTLVTY